MDRKSFDSGFKIFDSIEAVYGSFEDAGLFFRDDSKVSIEMNNISSAAEECILNSLLGNSEVLSETVTFGNYEGINEFIKNSSGEKISIDEICDKIYNAIKNKQKQEELWNYIKEFLDE